MLKRLTNPRQLLCLGLMLLSLSACGGTTNTPQPTITPTAAPPTLVPTREPSPTSTVLAETATPAATPTATLVATGAQSSSVPVGREELPSGAHVEKVLNANFPVALAFAPDGRLFYTEKDTGNVRVIRAGGKLVEPPVIHLDTDGFFERGMLGITLDAQYASNHFVWIYHTLPGNPPKNEVVRFRENNNVGTDPQVALSIPVSAGNHNGGNLHFGPDGMLYVTIGENADPGNSQDLDPQNFKGKLHRFAPTVPLSPAPGNPFPNSSIFAYGLRNSFDFDFDPVTKQLFATENGPACDDELNLIVPGGNYGWGRNYDCGNRDPKLNKPLFPLLQYQETFAPTGITFYRGDRIPEWRNELFFCGNNDGILRHVKLNPARNAVVSVANVNLGSGRCQDDVETGTDGALYIASTEAIYRIVR